MSKFDIRDGMLITKKGSLRLNEVDFLIPRKGWLLGQYIFIGTRFGQFLKLRVNNQEIEQILSELRAVKAPLIQNFDALIEFNGAAETLKEGSAKRMNSNSLWLTHDYIVFAPKRKILGSDASPVSIEIKNVRFSTTSPKKLFGILPIGYITYFGTSEKQAEFMHPNRDHSVLINDHLVSKGSPIGKESIMSFTDCFWLGKLKNPKNFFIQEEIGVTDDAVTYKLRNGKKIDSVYLPFKEISYLNVNKGRFHSNTISIHGQQNIMTQLEFSNDAIEKLRQKLSEVDVPEADKVIRPTTFFGLFTNPFAKRTITIVRDKFIYSDKKANDVITFTSDDITDIVWKKKSFFSPLGYLFVKGHIRNIRKDQADKGYGTASMPKIWFTDKNFIKEFAPSASYNNKKIKNISI